MKNNKSTSEKLSRRKFLGTANYRSIDMKHYWIFISSFFIFSYSLKAGSFLSRLKVLKIEEDGCWIIVFLTSQLDLLPPDKGKELAAFRKMQLKMPSKPEDGGEYDLVENHENISLFLNTQVVDVKQEIIIFIF